MNLSLFTIAQENTGKRGIQDSCLKYVISGLLKHLIGRLQTQHKVLRFYASSEGQVQYLCSFFVIGVAFAFTNIIGQ